MIALRITGVTLAYVLMQGSVDTMFNEKSSAAPAPEPAGDSDSARRQTLARLMYRAKQRGWLEMDLLVSFLCAYMDSSQSWEVDGGPPEEGMGGLRSRSTVHGSNIIGCRPSG